MGHESDPVDGTSAWRYQLRKSTEGQGGREGSGVFSDDTPKFAYAAGNDLTSVNGHRSFAPTRGFGAFGSLSGCHAVENLSAAERLLVGRCLLEAADGPYFTDWEFATLVGAGKPEIRMIASDWSSGQPISVEALQLIGSVLNNLIGYPYDHTAELERATGATMGDVGDVFRKLRA